MNTENEKVLFEIPQQFTTWEEAVVVYYKGPLIVHELRKMLGDEQWRKIIKLFYTLCKDKFATYNDFLTTLARFDKNGEITKRLDNYLKTKGFNEPKPE